MTQFESRDPSQPAFWDERFAAGFTPWEASEVPALGRWLDAGGLPAAARVLVPGCGSAREVGLLADRGCDVLAIDYAQIAVDRARAALPPPLAASVLRADFFAFESAPFDAIVERAFLAALPPRLWPAWASSCARLLKPGGVLAGVFFVDDAVVEPRRGPPFAIAAAELRALLAADFECVVDQPVPAAESAPVFAGRERWQQWRRR